jgi:uncharacterized protein YbbK (DUF523 family)/uncharacterized protein YbgA (DUF1722 family)
LLGERVRHDGAHKREPFLTDLLGRFVRFVPVCPEVEIGLGVPREPIRIVRDGRRLRLVGLESGVDHSAAMTSYAKRRARELGRLELCGYVLKSGSPSCGKEGVPIEVAGGANRSGRGFFAAELVSRLPLLAVEQEDRLGNVNVREHFIERVFAHARLRAFFTGHWTLDGLRDFHGKERTTLLAHDARALRRLDRLLGSRRRTPLPELADRYSRDFSDALSKPVTRARHADILESMSRSLMPALDAANRRRLRSELHRFRRGSLSLVETKRLLHALAVANAVAGVAEQTYLGPYPAELAPASCL